LNFLVFEDSEPVRESLCCTLLAFGIKGIPAATRAEAEGILARNPDIQGALVAIDNEDVGGAAFIKALAEGGKSPSCRIIVHTAQADKESVRRMLELGVVGYLLGPFEERSTPVKLRAILDRIAGQNAERKHVRVQPAPDELIRVSFRLPEQPILFAGKVIDISLGGMAVDLFRLPDGGGLEPGTLIERMEMSLLNKQIMPSGVVVACRAKALAVRFEPLSVRDKPVLERYIFRRSIQ